MFDYFFKNVLILFILFQFSFAQHIPSDERGDPRWREKSIIETNNVRTSIFNFGQTGRLSSEYSTLEQPAYEWPKESGHIYLALTQFLIGAEVEDKEGETRRIIITGNYRHSPQGETWNFEPVPGYFNSENFLISKKIASSKYTQTWPEYWPDKLNDNSDPGWNGAWNSYFGKNYFIPGEELFFRMSDNLYRRYNYFPDSTDTTRGGLGLLVDCRVFQFDEVPFRDMIFYSYVIKNDGTESLNKMGLSLWVSSLLGGDADSQDDLVNYDTTNNIIWFYDLDNRAPLFGNERVGMFSISYLKTPNIVDGDKELGITNIQKIAAGVLNINSDQAMWDDFMIPGKFFNQWPHVGGDYSYFISSSYFDLMPGETEELIFSIIFNTARTIPGQHATIEDFIEKHLVAEALYNSGFQNGDFELSFLNDPSNKSLSGEVEVSWNIAGNEGNAISFVYHSSDYGNKWEIIGIDSIGINKIIWDTDQFSDGVLNKLLIYSFADNGYHSVSSEAFIINKNDEDAKPQIYIIKPERDEEISGIYPLRWIGGDAEKEDVLIEVFYKAGLNSHPERIFSTTEEEGTYQWNTFDYANSNQGFIYATISTENDVTEYQTPPFKLYNERTIIDDMDELENIPATGWVKYFVADSSKLTGDTYLLEFSQTTQHDELQFNVYNFTTGTQLLNNIVIVDSTTESPSFDGLRLVIKNDPFDFIEHKSGWNSQEVIPFIFENVSAGIDKGIDDREDYQIIFSDNILDTSTTMYFTNYTFESMPVNFTVKSLITGETLPFGFIELDESTGPGKFSISGASRDRIVMLKKDNDQIFTNWIYLETGFESVYRHPESGDTLNVFQKRPFLVGDSLFFSPDIVNSIADEIIIRTYELSQNYPNPFNPITRIIYQISKPGFVKIKIFDVLGREIETLVNDYKNSGKYEIYFNASNFSSGVYVYRMEINNYFDSKKMMLIK